MAGGYGSSALLNSAELYDFAAGAWSVTGSLAAARNYHTATLLKDGQVLVTGGTSGGGIHSSTTLYNPDSGTWGAAGAMVKGRLGHSATLLPNGKVLVAGGNGGSGYLDSAELYDPAMGTWSATGSMNAVRSYHTATLLADGRVLVTGGFDSAGCCTASAELYDPATGTWSATGSLAAARYYHTATLLPDGKVLVAGGSDSGIFNSAELYDLATGTWSATGSMTSVRWSHTATLLPSGRVLVAAGHGGPYLNSAEIYDHATGSWSATGSLVTARQYHSATLLAGGQVMVVGGAGALTSAERYDPATGAWKITGALTNGRQEHLATLLMDGQVLVTGGQMGGPALASSERFDPGLGFDAAWRPVVSTAPAAVKPGEPFPLTGSGFQGISEASSGGGYSDSASNFPIVQLRRLDNGRTWYLHPDADGWSDSQFPGLPLADFPLSNFQAGPALITVFTNGIPSVSKVVLLTGLTTDDAMLRDIAAGWIGKSKHGMMHTPPTYASAYTDVSSGDHNDDWIQQLKNDGITEGCHDTDPLYCPKAVVDKTQAVKLILRAKHGGGHTPPAAVSALYADVPLSHADVDWINQAKNENITSGCDASNFCPTEVLTQAGFDKMLQAAGL